ncbi:hypothetical protein OTU49_007141, partial [Cherax quadricarinatus]
IVRYKHTKKIVRYKQCVLHRYTVQHNFIHKFCNCYVCSLVNGKHVSKKSIQKFSSYPMLFIITFNDAELSNLYPIHILFLPHLLFPTNVSKPEKETHSPSFIQQQSC